MSFAPNCLQKWMWRRYSSTRCKAVNNEYMSSRTSFNGEAFFFLFSETVASPMRLGKDCQTYATSRIKKLGRTLLLLTTVIFQIFGVVLFSVFSVVYGFTEIKTAPK